MIIAGDAVLYETVGRFLAFHRKLLFLCTI